MEIGVATFADLGELSARERMRNLLEGAALAEEVGLDVFGVGEHHRPDFAVSAPAVALAAIAARTSSIRLTSAVTVLSSDDPVRVFQEFAELDLLSGGRAEIMAGRGSFTESYPLFGYSLEDYDELFEEKLGLLLAVRASERVTWPESRFRAALDDVGVYPRPVQDPLPVWIGVGGTPQSVVRAAVLGLPLTVAIIGGEPARFAPLVDLYRRAAAQAGHDPAALPVAINSHGYVASTSAAADEFFPAYAGMMSRIGRERGWAPMSRPQFDALRSPRGALVVGSVDEVVEKILAEHALFGHQRFMAQISVGTMPHASVLRAIELLGTEVAPAVRAEVARRAQARAPVEPQHIA
jgi:probable LLM family oxidoreductase